MKNLSKFINIKDDILWKEEHEKTALLGKKIYFEIKNDNLYITDYDNNNKKLVIKNVTSVTCH